MIFKATWLLSPPFNSFEPTARNKRILQIGKGINVMGRINIALEFLGIHAYLLKALPDEIDTTISQRVVMILIEAVLLRRSNETLQ